MHDSTHRAPSAAQEWRAHWGLVLAALFGMSFAAVPSATLGLFMEPLNAEFGWTRTQISLGITIFAATSLVLTPLAGLVVDRFGSRRVAIPGMALSGIAFAGFGLLAGSIVQWLATWLALALASRFITTLVWTSAVSSVFQSSRGMAIAVLLSGLSLATAVVPILAHSLIEALGWRGAYIAVGLGWTGVALVFILIFFVPAVKAVPSATGAAEARPVPTVGGLTVKEAIRNFALQRIGFATFLQTTMGAAIAVHLVPLLSQSGLTRGDAAGMASILGVAAVVGKLVSGWLLDRMNSGLLPVFTFALPAVAHLLLLQDGGYWSIVLAMATLGYASGASLQLTTYLVTRYAGLRSFGVIFGLVSSLMALSAGIGPLLGGAIFDATGSYVILLTIGIVAASIAGLSLLKLGAYPRFDAAVE